jgi:hypothetical protein
MQHKPAIFSTCCEDILVNVSWKLLLRCIQIILGTFTVTVPPRGGMQLFLVRVNR